MDLKTYHTEIRKLKHLSSKQIKLKKKLILVFFIISAYIIGFLYFALTIKYEPNDKYSKTDAIIVLTGETKRITEGIKELSNNLANKLFISGVHYSAPIKLIIQQTIDDLGKDNIEIKNTLINKIETGKAENTIENAIESMAWIEKNNIKSIRLITSFYHIPRSRLLFNKYLPNTIIIDHPIKLSNFGNHIFENTKIFFLIFKEYNKTIATYLWNISGIEAETVLKFKNKRQIND